MLRESNGLKEGDKLLKAPPPDQPQLFHPIYLQLLITFGWQLTFEGIGPETAHLHTGSQTWLGWRKPLTIVQMPLHPFSVLSCRPLHLYFGYSSSTHLV